VAPNVDRQRGIETKTVRVALVYNADSTFVQRDRSILREAFDVRDVHWRGKRSIPQLASAVLRSDVTFSWFALDHAYGACRLARLFGRRTIVVVGGVDAARRADLNYGVHLDPRMGPRSRYALLHTDRVLVVDDSLRGEIAANTGIRRPEILTVHLGFDTEDFRPDGGSKNNVLTVGIVDQINLHRKGLLTFLECARLLPELPFVLVGARANDATARLRKAAPSNVRILGHVSDDQLRVEFRRARVYVQASEYEGLPTALGEAMSCACVPVGTQVAGIPTLIGNTGFYVPPADPVSTADAIRRAYDMEDGESARRRIIEHFSRDRRRDALIRIVEDLANG